MNEFKNIMSYEDFKKTTTFFMLTPSHTCFTFVIFLLIMVFVFFIWAFFSPWDEIVHAKIIIRPLDNVSNIRCIVSGEIEKKNYHNNDTVNAGDILFTLDTTSYELDLTSKKKQLCMLKKKMCENDIFINTIESNINQFEYLEKYSKECNENIKNYLLKLKSYENAVRECEIKIKREKDSPIEIRIPYILDDLLREKEMYDLEKASWITQNLSQALELRNTFDIQENELMSSIATLERAIRNATIIAPISGKIVEITRISVGSYILSGTDILKIVPIESDGLKVDVLISSNEIAKVQEGNMIRIRFEKLSPFEYGHIESRLDFVPPDSIRIGEENIYIAEALIPNSVLINRKGIQTQLVSGMSGEGRVITNRSTVLKIMLQKLEFI